MKKILALTIMSLIVSTVFGTTVKNLNIQTEYKLSRSDDDYLLAITSPANRVVRIVVPSERLSSALMPTNAVISGVALSNGTLHIVPENDSVVVLQADNAFRTRNQGSTWILKRIGRGFWVLDGDLYSLEVDAYVGEDITIKANVDPGATGPLRFIWYKNNVVLSGKTQSTLKLPSVTTVDSGNYRVDALNTAGTVKSETTNLLVR